MDNGPRGPNLSIKISITPNEVRELWGCVLHVAFKLVFKITCGEIEHKSIILTFLKKEKKICFSALFCAVCCCCRCFDVTLLLFLWWWWW